ncbi:hypothetical protein A2U01_0071222, partial [Trifolium medium]|nr:hypothetical protein [Trifolium medium]
MVITFNFTMSSGYTVIAINLSSIGLISGKARNSVLRDVVDQGFSSNVSSIWV